MVRPARSRRQCVVIWLHLAFVLLVCPGINAIPNGSHGQVIHARDNSGPQSSGFTVQVWAPLVAISVVIVVMIVYSCIKRRVYFTGFRINNRPNGSTPESQPSNGSSSTASTEARRQRRPRRTPSQVSTRSLPAYMKDPGDSEMVLVRGTRYMEDPMPTLQEGEINLNASGSLGDLGDSNASQNSRTHLLGSQSNLYPREADTRPSVDTVRTESEDSLRALLQDLNPSSRPNPEGNLPVGQAPPYSEFIGEVDIAEEMEMRSIRSRTEDTVEPTVSPTASSLRGAVTPQPANTSAPGSVSPSPSETTGRQHSGFRSITARLSHFVPSTASPASPSTSTMPPESRAADQVTPSSSILTRHRSTNSGSTLTSIVSHTLLHSRSTRSLRTNTSATNLTSPSATSLGPISAPLPHTLFRTEFEYPRGGPTSEQMKFISSRESLGKFGVPYGLAAQAQALASREALALSADTAPPPFESPVVESPEDMSLPSLRTDDPERIPADETDSPHSTSSTAIPVLERPAAPTSDTVFVYPPTRISVVSAQNATERRSFSESDHKSEVSVDIDMHAHGPTLLTGGPLPTDNNGIAHSSAQTLSTAPILTPDLEASGITAPSVSPASQMPAA